MIFLKQSTAAEIGVGPFVDNTDGFTIETLLTITSSEVQLKKNGADWAAKNEGTSLVHEVNGFYRCLLNATDTNTLGVMLLSINEAGALPVFLTIHVLAANVYDSFIGGGDTLDVQVTGIGASVITATAIATDAITAAKVATDTIAEIADGVLDEIVSGHLTSGSLGDLVNDSALALVSLDARVPAALDSGRMVSHVESIEDGAIVTETFTAGAIDATVLAANAIGASQLDADAVAEIANAVQTPWLVASTADGGTTTTIIDASLTESAVDHWAGNWVMMVTGALAGQTRLITAFDPSTDTLTVTPAFTGAVAFGMIFRIMPAAGVALSSIALSAVTSLRAVASGQADSGTTTTMVDAARVESIADYWVGATILFTNGTLLGVARQITAFNPTTDTITVSPALPVAAGTHTYEILPGGPVRDVTIGAGGITTSSFVAGAIDNSALASNAISANKIATGAITSAKLAANAIDAAALATDAVTEIQTGLATAANLTTAQGGITTILGRIPAALVGGRIDASVGAMADDTLTAAALATSAVAEIAAASSGGVVVADIADAVWDEARSGHNVPGTFGQGVASVQGSVTGSVASVVGAVGSIANGGILAGSIAVAAANKIADHILRRSYGDARTSGDGGTLTFKSLLGAMGKIVNPWRIVGTTISHYQEDGATVTAPGTTQTITGTSGADPITRIQD